MKGSVVLVAATLVAAIVVTVVLLLASSARGIGLPKSQAATIDPSAGERRVVDNFPRHRGVINLL